MTYFFYTLRYQKIGTINQILENTHKKMCIQNSPCYFIVASVIDMAVWLIVGAIGVNILTPSFNCVNKDVVVHLNVMVLVCVFGLHILEMIIQCCVGYHRTNAYTTDDDQFNPKSFWSGIFFTFLHLIKLLVICIVILPNLKYPQETCDNTIIFFSILLMLVAIFVVVSRVIGHIKHKQIGQK